MKRYLIVLTVYASVFAVQPALAAEPPVSEATEGCLDCHAIFHPGIVEDWRKSRHAVRTPAEAVKEEELSRRVSAEEIPEDLQHVVVGCAECHTLRNDAHADKFDHNEVEIHVVVSPDDCATCHPKERGQFSQNIMAHARKNLAENPVYQKLQRTILGKTGFENGRVRFDPEDPLTRADACFYCHGTKLEVDGFETRDTDAGELEFPKIKGWPNQGVGRVNLDGSLGSCAACHTRHRFSIEMARKPHTCKECHVGPDVPAFKVYSASKHGNIYTSMNGKWNFDAVPWTIGKDIGAPTCATCHISLVVNTDGEVINERTHRMNDRLSMRIFGIIYAHPHPIDPDTTKIRNKDGLPLPTDFDGGLADGYLIGKEEQEERRRTMQATCLACHASSWVNGYFSRLDHSIQAANQNIRTATDMIKQAWDKGYAKADNPFDESMERLWTDAWLLYANNIRFVSAMAGGGDYGVFEDGRYHLTKALLDLQDRLSTREMLEKQTAAKP